MFKIYESGNYFYIEETASSKLFKGHKKDVLVSQTFEGGTEFCFVGIFGNFGCKNCIEFADIVDLNDAPFASLQAFIDFYEANTGNFNSGVPAALNGPVNRLINYFANDYTHIPTNMKSWELCNKVLDDLMLGIDSKVDNKLSVFINVDL